MNNLAKEINQLLLDNPSVKEYLKLREEIKKDNNLQLKKSRLDSLRKEICSKDKIFTEEYYDLLSEYKSDPRVSRYEKLNIEIKDLLTDISDILMLK